jgi:hypothetical protein
MWRSAVFVEMSSSRRPGVDTETLAEAHRHEGAVQAMLERQAHAEVSRQTQRRDDLCGTNLFVAQRRVVGYDATRTSGGRSALAKSSFTTAVPPGVSAWVCPPRQSHPKCRLEPDRRPLERRRLVDLSPVTARRRTVPVHAPGRRSGGGGIRTRGPLPGQRLSSLRLEQPICGYLVVRAPRRSPPPT